MMQLLLTLMTALDWDTWKFGWAGTQSTARGFDCQCPLVLLFTGVPQCLIAAAVLSAILPNVFECSKGKQLV